MVGATGFEPATPCSQSRCATKLRYAPTRNVHDKRRLQRGQPENRAPGRQEKRKLNGRPYQLTHQYSGERMKLKVTLFSGNENASGGLPAPSDGRDPQHIRRGGSSPPSFLTLRARLTALTLSRGSIFLSCFLTLFSSPAPAKADEVLDTEHSHYREQIERIRNSLEQAKDQKDQKETLADARRTARWVFEEPAAARTEGDRLNRRISKEFLELGIPVVIHPAPSRPVILQKFTDHSIRITDFERGLILVRVSVPFLRDGAMKRSRSIGILLATLLLKDQILALPLRERIPLSKYLPSEALKPKAPLAMEILSRALSPTGFHVRIMPLAAGGGIVVIHMELPIPLHLAQNKAIGLDGLTLSSEKGSEKLRRGLPPTGLIVDARRLHVTPFRDILLASSNGQILMKPDDGRDSGSLPHGWAGFSEAPSPAVLKERVGPHPLVVRPDALIHHQLFLLSQKDFHRVSLLFSWTGLLKTGHILVRVAPLAAMRSTPSPKVGNKKSTAPP